MIVSARQQIINKKGFPLRFKVQSSKFKGQSSKFKVQGSMFKVPENKD
jgi:hypothetical protein